jgi:hypothetical protein
LGDHQSTLSISFFNWPDIQNLPPCLSKPTAEEQGLVLGPATDCKVNGWHTASLSVLGFEHNNIDTPAILLWNAGSNEFFDLAPRHSQERNTTIQTPR